MRVQKTIKFKVGKLSNNREKRLNEILYSLVCFKCYGHMKGGNVSI